VADNAAGFSETLKDPAEALARTPKNRVIEDLKSMVKEKRKE
jgi:hypothetical protein